MNTKEEKQHEKLESNEMSVMMVIDNNSDGITQQNTGKEGHVGDDEPVQYISR